jgi:hypothetical protein
MECESPISDMQARMRAAAVTRVLLVETWNGRNRSLLEAVSQSPDRDTFPVALCYRPERQRELNQLARAGRIVAIRISTADLPGHEGFWRGLPDCGTALIAHAESGIGPLAAQLVELHRRVPKLRLYVPHLGWPGRDGQADPDWPAAIATLAAVPTVTLGVSAIAHFSTRPYPHDDVRELALRVIASFPASRIVVGSDYPLFDKARYGDYLSLALDWVASVHPNWNDSIVLPLAP